MTMLVVAQDTCRAYDWHTEAGTVGWEQIVPQAGELETLRDSTLSLLDAERLSPGEYEVIASGEVGGLIAHESFGHGVEMDMFLKERARARDYVGKPVASPLVDLYEDPTLPGGNGSYFFDDEGQPAASKRDRRRCFRARYHQPLRGTPSGGKPNREWPPRELRQ
jgi:TldD protein